MKLIEDQTFENIDFTKEALPIGKYDFCRFNGCQLNGLDLSTYAFVESTFHNCDLSLAKITDTIFTDTEFQNCKMLGMHFDTADQFIFTVSFQECRLDNSVFYQMDLRKVKFDNCQLIEVDFSEADCSKIAFDDCEMSKTTFDQTILKGCDFRTAIGYKIDPNHNTIKGAKFSRSGIHGLLTHLGITIE